MQKFQGKSGDGLGALGLKQAPDGTYALISVDTVIRDEAPFLRKAGMGGARYMRHCLESVVLERGGLWMPETIENALDILEKIDGGLVTEAKFESWVYVADGDKVDRQSIKPNVPLANAALQHRKFIEKDINWPALLQQTADQANEEIERDSLRVLWVDRYADTLGKYRQNAATDGQLLCALLTRQAYEERMFLHETVQTGEFATEPFLKMIGARYIRALCQFDLSAADQKTTNPLAPDLTEIGRTILLLCAAGRVPEAMELGARAAPYINPETLFVPIVPRLALALASNQDTLLETEEHDFGSALRANCQAALQHLRGSADVDISTILGQIIDGRMRQMGSFSDEYHIDFDDGLSWAMPYEACAITALCQHFKRAVPVSDHTAMTLPTAVVPDLRSARMPYQDTYAVFLERRA